MRRILGLAGLLSLLVVACQVPFRPAPGNGGRIQVSFGVLGSRSVVADFAASGIATYDLSLTDPNGIFSTRTGSVAGAAGSYSFTGVEATTWTLGVTAKNASGQVLGTGSANVINLVSGETRSLVVPIVFSIAATGGFSLPLSFPSSLTDSGGTVHNVDYVEGKIRQYTSDPITPSWTSSVLTPAITDLGGGYSGATFAYSGLPSGANLDLVLTFRTGGAGGSLLGVYTESLNIWDYQTSDRWIDASGQLVSARTFQASDFYDSNANLADLSVTTSVGGPVGFSFSSCTQSYVFSVPPGDVVIHPTQSVAGQHISYAWDGAGLADLASGQASAPFTLTTGPHSLTVQVRAPNGAPKTYDFTVSALTYSVYGFDRGLWRLAFPAPDYADHLGSDGGGLVALALGQASRSVDGVWQQAYPSVPSGISALTLAHDLPLALAGSTLQVFDGIWRRLTLVEPLPVTALDLAFHGEGAAVLGSDGEIWGWDGVWKDLTTAPAGATAIASDGEGSRILALSGTTLWQWQSGIWTAAVVPELPAGTVNLTVFNGSLYALVVK